MVTQSYCPMAGPYDGFEEAPLMSSIPAQYGFHQASYVYLGEDPIRGGPPCGDVSLSHYPRYAAVSRVAAHTHMDRLQRSVRSEWSAPHRHVRRSVADHCPVPVVRPAPRVVRFPWMKTTKSHAHQWKAHWA
ncbi:hypothetical protein LSAT2_015362, partial [Lamellibrachia satsuma]